MGLNVPGRRARQFTYCRHESPAILGIEVKVSWRQALQFIFYRHVLPASLSRGSVRGGQLLKCN